jgi:catechol 2,3-dioxygenase-like lactoylglutathione lyase family enzyme
MVKTHGLSHININVSDIKRSLAFYQSVFGLKEMFREGPKMVFLNTPGTHDVITLHESEPIGNLGIAHFGFSLQDKKDIDKALKEVEHAGGKLIRRGEHAPGYPFAYVSDPDGYVLEL